MVLKQNYRKFNGQNFYLTTFTPSKATAMRVADAQRNIGNLARVVQVSMSNASEDFRAHNNASEVWAVYVRPGPKLKPYYRR